MANIYSLPPELLLQILSRLDLQSLLTFGRSSRTANEFASASVHSLFLGIYPSRIASIISQLWSPSAETAGSDTDEHPSYSAAVIVPRSLRESRGGVLTFQNRLAESVILRYAHALRNLQLVVWELSESTASALIKAANLRSVDLRLDHPHIRHQKSERSRWHQVEGGTVWNAFGDEGVWGRLEALSLERSDITAWQLGRILQENKCLRELRLHECGNLGKDFWEMMEHWEGRDTLEVLHFTGSTSAEIDEDVLQHISAFVHLRSLSFRQCPKLDNAIVKRWNNDVWHIPQLVLPQLPNILHPGSIEVDPAYIASR